MLENKVNQKEINAKKVFTFNYTVSDYQGNIIASSNGKPNRCFEGSAKLLPAMNEALKNLSAGEHITLFLPADQAYGPRLPGRTIQIDRAKLDKDPLLGEVFIFETGTPVKRMFKVTEITDQHVILDGNHPLAGVDIQIEIELIHVRPCTFQEMWSGKISSGF